MAPITAAIGGAPSHAVDANAQIVQGALNRFPIPLGGPWPRLATDGKCGKKTLDAIKVIQRRLGMARPDARVDVNGHTYKTLAAGPSAMSPSTISYQVPNVPLIAQTKTWACWYASAQMLIEWKRDRSRATLKDNPDPSDIPETVRMHAANNGLAYSDVLKLAKLLGLKAVPPMSLSLFDIASLLQQYGPLWTHGTSHVIVLAGVNEGLDRVLVHDPAPMNVGRKEWRSYSTWFIYGGAPDSQATDAGVAASFLYIP
jgi:hypothetical protein